MKRSSLLSMTAALAGLLAAHAASAADLSETKVKGIGLNSKTIVSFGDEVPFWNKTIPEASGGKVTAEFSPIDLAGVKDQQIMRLTPRGSRPDVLILLRVSAVMLLTISRVRSLRSAEER